MSKRLLSLAMALCMVLSLLPAAAFADENAETPVCTCEEACTTEDMDVECAVCGAEGAAVENCCKYTVPATETQTEVTKTEETEPETARTETTESEEADSETTESEEAEPEAAESEDAGQETTESEDAGQETVESEDGQKGTETEAPVCSCEDACTADAMDAECPVCGAEGAVVENCGKYIAPVVEEQTEEVVQMGAPASEEPEQTAVEKVQAMIDALPTVEDLEDADDEKVDEVYAAVQNICDALDELGEEELDQITGLDKLAALMEWFTEPVSTYEGEDYPYLNYTIEDNGTITITGLKDGYKDTTDVTIPAKIGSYDVTAIGGWSFEDCKNITRVNLPASITSIGKNAFKNCTNLESINIPYGVTSIGWYAFANCTKLASITIPSSVTTIEDGVFQDCTGLTSITIPSSVTRICYLAFSNCTGLTSITIPSSVTRIDGWAFSNCTSLKSVTIPSSVTEIQVGIFNGCTKLTSVTIPNSVKEIHDRAFGYCSGLKDVYYLGTKEEWGNIVIIHDGNTDLIGNVRCVGDITQGFSFTPPSNLTYDGKAKEATVTKNNQDYDAFTIKYYDQNGQVYTTGPIDAGTYTVKIDIEQSQTYDAISGYEVGRYTILQAENSFTTDLSIEGWTYDDTPKAPIAAAKFGTPTYSYSTEEDGTYTTTQPTNAGTYWVKAVVEGTDNYTGLEAKIQFTILPKTYTVTYAAGSNGTGTVAAGSKTHGVAFILSSYTFTRAGYEQKGWAATDGGEKVYDLGGTYTEDKEITLYPVWRDIAKPAGEISIGTDSWTTSPADITFDLFFRDTQTVTITASDNSGEDVTIGYLLSDKELSAGELDAAAFTPYNGGFTIDPDRECVIYAKLTDTSGNVEYISSNGIVLDATAPVISGIKNYKTYCSAQTVTVSDNDAIEKVTVNDEEVSLDENSQFILSPSETKHTIVATDQAGNSTKFEVTINDGHRDGDNNHMCDFCQALLFDCNEGDTPGHNCILLHSPTETDKYRSSGPILVRYSLHNKAQDGDWVMISLIDRDGKEIQSYNVNDPGQGGANIFVPENLEMDVYTFHVSLMHKDETDAKPKEICSAEVRFSINDAPLIEHDKTIDYQTGLTYDVKEMFLLLEDEAVFENAGFRRQYSLAGGTGEGTLNGSELTVTKPGTFLVKVLIKDWDGSFPCKDYETTATLTVTAYDITYDLDGGAAAGNPAYYGAGDTVTLTAPEKEGFEFLGWSGTGLTGSGNRTVTIPAGSRGERHYTAHWLDTVKPTGRITAGTESWDTFSDGVTFERFYKEAQTVTIQGNDNSKEAVGIEYLLSDRELTESELAAETWEAYGGAFLIEPGHEWIIYAKLTDSTGNTCYINSEGIVLDAAVPVISGIENGKAYCAAQTVTVSDKYAVTVTVNGSAVTLTDGKFTLSPAEGTQVVVVTDKAGNQAEMSVTVNDGHTYEWQSENGKYWKKCQVCGDETAKKDIPAITINGADKVCVTQEYRFSFTLPEGTADPIYGYDFTTKGDMGLAAVIENGEPYGVVPAEWYDLKQSSFEVYAGATTEDGFEFFVSKTVALQGEHTDADPKDHICDVCGAVLSQHSGGEATCISSAICEYCGEKYGEPDPTNHDLEHVPAKAATVTETGNIEYWQCKECGEIFSDPDGKNEITLEDTVIAKLPPKIIEGTGQSVTAGEKKALSFRSNAAFSDFIRVELDGKTLDEKNYTAKEGSTVVTLDAGYVSTLSIGEHTIGIVSESGTAATKFTVNTKTETDSNTNSPQTEVNNTNTPQTGDNSPIALWIALLFASGYLLTVTGIYGKKKKYNR